jgi:hypothetical protein
MTRRNTILATIALSTSCGQPYIDMDVGGDAGSESSTSTSAPEVEAPDNPERQPQQSDEAEGDSGDDPGVGFIEAPDGGGQSHECDIWAQDCGTGEKCNFWANDGGGAWNATKCVPIDPNPDGLGQECSVVDSGVSGIDSCVLGALCWNVDPETNLGECVAYCTGSEANPTCPDPTTNCVGRDLMLCLPTCCPVEQTCDEGEACYPNVHTFHCMPDAGADSGALGDACEYVNVCDPGLFCASSEAVPGCAGSTGCCTRFCDVGADQCTLLHPAMECIPWYEEGQAPPGEEHIGGCMVPS